MEFFSQLTSSFESKASKTPKGTIAFYGPTGTGKSTLLLNIARTIQKESAYEPSICIIDLNVLFPTTHFKLHQDDLTQTKHHIGEVLEKINDGDTETFEEAFILHTPTGIHLLNHAADITYNFKKAFTYDNVNMFIDRCKKRFDLVFIDLPATYMEDAVNSGLLKADTICLIVTDDLAQVMHARKQLSVLKLLEERTDSTYSDKISILSNRKDPNVASKKLSISDDLLKSTLYQRPILGEVYEKNEVSYHHNHGNFACDHDEAFRKDIEKIARQLYPFEIEVAKKETKIDLKRNKESWIALYGSEHLKNCTQYGYNCQRLYVEERAKQEFEGWTVDFDDTLQVVSRSCPTPAALEAEIQIRKDAIEELNLRVMWNNATKKEVLVIRDYLEKYRLYKPFDE